MHILFYIITQKYNSSGDYANFNIVEWLWHIQLLYPKHLPEGGRISGCCNMLIDMA